MRRPVIAGNWKMYKTIAETRAFLQVLLPDIRTVDHCDVVVAPPFTALQSAVDEVKGRRVAIAAQNVHWKEEGAFTGEVSARMLFDAGCTFTIVGHSERRQYFGDSDESVEKKVRASLSGGLKPIVCVGETLEERDANRAFEVVRRQISNGIGQLTPSDLSRIIVAYEPVWAIGTGRTATPELAAEMHGEIRRIFAGIYGASQADGLRILYGGSVKPDNIAALMQKDDIDGALVGGASLDPASFASIVKYST